MRDFDTTVPIHLMQGLKMYVVDGIQPGSFLTAVICNDLKEACACADPNSARHIWGVVHWLYNFAPSGCWGSRDRMVDWINHGGKNGIYHDDIKQDG